MADSELKTLELKAMIRKIETFRTSMPDKLRIMQRFYDAVFEAGMRAGEIAMKEKAAKTVEHFADELTPEEWPQHGLYPTAGRFDGGWSEKVVPVLAKWVRALPLSGAEESKKEKAPDGINEG